MRINLDGPFHLSRLILKGMVERGYGRAVYTSSTAGEHAEHAGSAYSSSKHGLIGLMRSVAQDGGRLWHHLECRITRLGAHGNGRAFGPRRSEESWHYA